MVSFNFGVIGCGSRAASLARTLMKDERGDLIALCDIRPEALEKYTKVVEKDLGRKPKTYTHYLDLLRDPEIDAVVIATPDYLHHNMAVEAFKSGKHVFLEKPVGIYLDQMVDILNAAQESGKILEVGYVLRYAPFFIELKKLLENGKIGRPYFVTALEEYYGAYHFYRGWWRKKANTGGIMVQKICHDMDLFYWLFGKPRRVVAFENLNDFKPGGWDSKAKYCSQCENHCPYFCTQNSRTYSDECVYNGDHDIADNSQILIEFENGVNVSMGMNFFNARGQSDRHWRVVGSKGELTGSLSENLFRFDGRHDVGGKQTTYLECAPGALGGHGGGDGIQMIAFLDAISGGREAKAGMKSAYWSSILVMSAQLAADCGQVVYIADIVEQYPFPG